jgi:hypothetical protein
MMLEETEGIQQKEITWEEEYIMEGSEIKKIEVTVDGRAEESQFEEKSQGEDEII